MCFAPVTGQLPALSWRPSRIRQALLCFAQIFVLCQGLLYLAHAARDAVDPARVCRLVPWHGPLPSNDPFATEARFIKSRSFQGVFEQFLDQGASYLKKVRLSDHLYPAWPGVPAETQLLPCAWLLRGDEIFTLLLVGSSGLHLSHLDSPLEVSILTGRKHQIRVHLAEEGHPVVGDTRP